MFSVSAAALGLAVICLASSPAAAVNVAPLGKVSLGHNATNGSALGSPYSQQGVSTNLTDASGTSSNDTFGSNGTGFDWAAVIFDEHNLNQVSNITVRFRNFGDGGWYGATSNALPLPAANLIPPKIQATTNSGASWFDVSTSNNYVAIMTGQPAVAGTPAVTFTFGSPLSNVNGLRMIGDGGGQADGNGFLGVTDFRIEAVAAEFVAANIAIPGIATAITGHNTADNGTLGTLHANAGASANIIDNSLSSRVDTFSGTSGAFDFAGVTFAQPQNSLTKVVVSNAVFFDGGWFGAPGNGPGAAGSLSGADLLEPKVQVTFDGTNWVDVAFHSDYLEKMTGLVLPQANFGPPTSTVASFFIDQEIQAARGIRLFGQGGGGADGNGFLGIFDFQVFQGANAANAVPEPASAMLGLIGLGALALRRRRAA